MNPFNLSNHQLSIALSFIDLGNHKGVARTLQLTEKQVEYAVRELKSKTGQPHLIGALIAIERTYVKPN